jgi:hypothetical protein
MDRRYLGEIVRLTYGGEWVLQQAEFPVVLNDKNLCYSPLEAIRLLDHDPEPGILSKNMGEHFGEGT